MDEDSFALNIYDLFESPVNIYFYDGHHSQESQKKAFTYYDEILDNVFIALIDDWHWINVRIGTYQAFDELGYEVLFEEALGEGYWNGQYLAVIRKK